MRILNILLGLLKSIRNPSCFNEFFDWFYPDYMNTLAHVVQTCQDNLDLHKLILKFLRELSSNQTHRLKLDNINAFIMFKAICPILFTILNYHTNKEYRPIVIILETLRNFLIGRYISFDYLGIYNDRCFIDLILKLFTVILTIDIKDYYPKLTNVLYSFLSSFFSIRIKDAVKYLVPELFNSILIMLYYGIESQRSSLVLPASSAIEEISHFFSLQILNVKSEFLASVKEILVVAEGTLLKITEELIRTICFDDEDYISLLLSPLYSLISIDKRLFQEAKKTLFTKLPNTDSISKLDGFLDNIANTIEFNGNPEDRDKFISNYLDISKLIKETYS